MSRTSRSASRGFTLVEMMMALLVMTVGLLGLLQSVNVAYEHNARNRMREEAVQLAEEQMNEFRLMKFDNVTATKVHTSIARELAGSTRYFQVTRDCLPVGTGSLKCVPNEGESKKLSVAVTWQFHNVTSEHVIYTMKNK